VAIATNVQATGPKVTMKPAKMAQAEGSRVAANLSGQSAALVTPLNYSTGFEAATGFTPRDATCVQNACVAGPGSGGTGYTGQCGFIGDGTQGNTGYPEPWGVSTTNTQLIEGHIDTAHPFSGTQHLRIQKDICDATNFTGLATDARIPPGSPQPGIIAPATISQQIAISGLFGADLVLQPQANSQGLWTTRIMFFYYGFFYVLEDKGAGLQWWPQFTYWDATGAYQNMTIIHDPCARFKCLGGPNNQALCPNGNIDCRECVGGANDGLPCVAAFQCPGGSCDGGDCLGSVEWVYAGSSVYKGTMMNGTTTEQMLYYTDGFPGNNDIDDLSIVTGEPCPTICGNLEVEAGEQCDGVNDVNCPGRCIAPGQTGPGGEAECTCIIGGLTCEDATPLLNGDNSVITHGGWWTFVADTPAYAIDMCNTLDYDSYLYVYTGTCNTLESVAFNDDCNIDDPDYGPGADPLAPCHPVGPPYQACTCVSTTIGQQYWVGVRTVLGAETAVSLNKRQDCGAIWNGGACCDGYGNCADDVLAADCSGYGDVWTQNKYCTTVEPCDVTLGACCDAAPGLNGLCTDGVMVGDCTGTWQTFTLGAMCANVTCTEIKGACCNGFLGTCSQTIQSACTGQNMTWTINTPCSGVTCEAVPGACCDGLNPDPLATVGICTDGVIMADCQGETLTWTKNALCSEIPCPAIFQAIPTVSEWGLVVLALLLLVGAKVYFSRRQAAA